MIFCSYRDPNLVETLNVYKELPQYLREFTLTDREMRKYIIGTMSSLDLPMTPALRGPRAMGMYFSGAKLEDKVAFRKQVIACKPEDIVALADVVEPVLRIIIFVQWVTNKKLKTLVMYSIISFL